MHKSIYSNFLDISDLLQAVESGAPQSVLDAIDYQSHRAHNELKQSLIQFLQSAPSFFQLMGESGKLILF